MTGWKLAVLWALGSGCAAAPRPATTASPTANPSACPLAAVAESEPAVPVVAPVALAPATVTNDDFAACHLIDTQQAAHGDTAFALDGLGINPGTPLPTTALPHELFRVPLIWPTSHNAPMAIGFEQPGDAAGIVFANRGCVVNKWSFSFGGNGVDVARVEPHLVYASDGWQVLVVVEVQGRYRGHGISDQPDEDVPAGEHHRSVLFTMDEHRVGLLFDTDNLPATVELPISLEQTPTGKLMLAVGEGPVRWLDYDPTTRTLADWQ